MLLAESESTDSCNSLALRGSLNESVWMRYLKAACVFGYPAARGSTEPLEHSSIWRRPKSPKSKRVQVAEKRRFQSTPSSITRVFQKHYSPVVKSTSPARSSPLDIESLSPRSRPKHIPIVVPRYVPIIAPNSLCDSSESSPAKTFASASSECPSIVDFLVPGRKPSADSGKFKSRHVEILIPDWARPAQTLLDPPINASSEFSASSPPLPTCKRNSSIKMARQTPNTSRANTMDSSTSAPSPSQLYNDQFRSGSGAYISSVNSSQTSLPRAGQEASEREPQSATTRTPASGITSTGPSPAIQQTAGLGTPSNPTSGLSGLVCNVHRTTGREPHPLVGATTTILGDKLYVFGGRRLSRTRPQLTADLYELDLIKRHWTKLDTKGDIPPPRYFHSVCALGDTKLVCYGGMSPASAQTTTAQTQQQSQDGQPEVVVMSDIHIYDVPTRTWMNIPTADSPQGRYAHCATILPSSAVFSSPNAPLSAIHHNPPSANPNQGSIGVALDGTGGAEMVVVGGQDSANHYIEQISVFNLRSLKWTATNSLGKSCGAYRSVVAPLSTMDSSMIGTGRKSSQAQEAQQDQPPPEGGASMLIYSNYNFLDVKLELQVRLPDGSLVEKPMNGSFSPPGLRFPNGGVIDDHFVVSGTFLTSSKQEYALWALDLRTLTWSRIDAGGNIFTQGSWNRGILWSQRNIFVILGNRKRSLVEDYNHRRINFSNICMVELEAFGLYDNPRKVSPSSGYLSISAPVQREKLDNCAGGRKLLSAAEELGQMASQINELADMDFLAIGGERIPVNSHLIARRWGPYFNQLLREGASTLETADTATLRPTLGQPSRNSSITITPSIKTSYSNATTAVDVLSSSVPHSSLDPADYRNPPPSSRPRTLYLPHTHLTIKALVHYFYTSSLPPTSSPLCTPQILCSLLQLARPYRVDGLLEAVIERLHFVLDGRNTAAIFNAAAMAAGGGDGVAFFNTLGLASYATSSGGLAPLTQSSLAGASADNGVTAGLRSLRINTDVAANGSGRARADDEISSAGGSASASDIGSGIDGEREVWSGETSAVVGLQKRGLRGLMEGRRIREMGRGGDSGSGPGGDRIGLGIA